MCLWRENFLQVQKVSLDTWFILLSVKIPTVDTTVLVRNVYGPHTPQERRICFAALKSQVLRHGGLVFLSTDFNTVLLGSERSSGGALDTGDLIFQQFVQDSSLLDLPLNNGEYTWFSSRQNGLWSRLDR